MSNPDKPYERIDPANPQLNMADFTRLQEKVEGFNISGFDCFEDENGKHFAPRRGGKGGADIRIFEVQSAGTGDGIYNCYEQTLDATEWADTAGDPKFDDKDAVSIGVLNLQEYDPPSAYVAKLAAGDMLAAWQMTDDEGTKRWVGIPLKESTGIRRAYCAANAGASTIISAYLDTDHEGDPVDVQCKIAGGGYLNDAWPILTDGLEISVWNDNGTWKCTTIFQKKDPLNIYFEVCG